MYTATLIVLGKKYSAKGKTVSEAIADLKPGIVKGRGILVIEKGDKKVERVLMPTVTSRLFMSHGLTREVALKNASLLFAL